MSRIIKAETLVNMAGPAAAACAVVDRPRQRASRAAASLVDSASIVQAARERAASILKAAQLEATRLMTEEAERLAVLREQAAQEGYEEGYARGYDEGIQQAERTAEEGLRQELASVRAAAHQLSEVRTQALAASESDMVKFAVLIAEKILRAELSDPQRTLDIARSLLSEVRDESRVCLYLPAELDISDADATALVSERMASGMQLELKSDPSLALGDVRVETAWGWIDGRASVRWERLIEALKRGVENDDEPA